MQSALASCSRRMPCVDPAIVSRAATALPTHIVVSLAPAMENAVPSVKNERNSLFCIGFLLVVWIAGSLEAQRPPSAAPNERGTRPTKKSTPPRRVRLARVPQKRLRTVKSPTECSLLGSMVTREPALSMPTKMTRQLSFCGAGHFVTTPSDALVQLGQVGTLIIGSIGICVALANQRRQLNAQMFIEYSGRFQELLRLFPTEAWLANRNPSQPLPPSSQEIRDCTLYCIQFIADVYQLHKGGYISKHLWMLWEREIRHTLAGPLFQREWEGVASEFTHNRDFLHYVSSLVHCKRPQR